MNKNLRIFTLVFSLCSLMLLPLVSSQINYGLIPDDWYLTPEWIPTQNNKGVFLVTNVTHGSSYSMMLSNNGTANNPARENDAISIIANQSDNIVFDCWIKCEASTLNDTTGGGRIGVDFYGYSNGSYHRINGLQSDGAHGIFPNEDNDAIADWYVPFGSDWTQRTMNYTLPNTGMVASDGSYYPLYQEVEALFMIPWVQVWSNTNYGADGANVYFSDITITVTSIAGVDEATPTPTPQATAQPQYELFGFVGQMSPIAGVAFVGGIILVGLVWVATLVKKRKY